MKSIRRLTTLGSNAARKWCDQSNNQRLTRLDASDACLKRFSLNQSINQSIGPPRKVVGRFCCSLPFATVAHLNVVHHWIAKRMGARGRLLLIIRCTFPRATPHPGCATQKRQSRGALLGWSPVHLTDRFHVDGQGQINIGDHYHNYKEVLLTI